MPNQSRRKNFASTRTMNHCLLVKAKRVAPYVPILTSLALSLGISFAGSDSPRDLEHTAASIPTLRFINYYVSDFRLLFCSESALADRIARSVCVVDIAGGSKEIEISPGDTVDTIARRLGLSVNGPFQLRLIQKLEISQSAMPRDPSDTENVAEANRQMLKRRVFPGDMIVNITIYEWDRGTSGVERVRKETSR